MGMIQVKVSYKSKSCSLPLIIVKQGSVNLAGHNWVYSLNLKSVFKNASQVNNIPESFIIQKLLVEFKDLFSSELG